jgi:putative addiction module component (TIGR02574 family)
MLEWKGAIMSTELAEQIKKLSVSERILLVEEIWDSIAADDESLELTQKQKDELDRRIAADQNNPIEGRTWEEIKAESMKTR